MENRKLDLNCQNSIVLHLCLISVFIFNMSTVSMAGIMIMVIHIKEESLCVSGHLETRVRKTIIGIVLRHSV